jgi:hypothetical protein
VVQVTVAPRDETLEADTNEMTGGMVLLTFTATGLDTVEFVAASRATAVRLWLPLLARAVFQETP